MPIQWKLLIVLLTVAIPPLFIIGFFDQQAAKTLIKEMVNVRQEDVTARAGDALLHHTRDYALVANRQLRLMKAALQSTGREVAATRGNRPVSLPVGLTEGDFSTLSLIIKNGAVLQLWPERSATPPEKAPAAAGALFRRAAAATGPVLIAKPGTTPKSMASLIGTVAVPSPDGGVAVLVADLSFESTLRDISQTSMDEGDMSSLVGYFSTQNNVLLPLTQLGPSQAADITRTPPSNLIADLARAKSGMLNFELNGEDHLVAYAPIDDKGLFLFLSRSVAGIGEKISAAEARVNRRMEQQIMVGGMSLVLLLFAAVILSFIGARSITRPVKELRAVARRIAGGDLEARCHIHTGDELEDLANAFNEMLPKLNDRIKMQDALGLAMEVQQKLLPAEAPSIPGFDIAGHSIYCDETGGDYYDFIETAELENHQVGIAVGDVTGHGIAAALLMASARALLRSHASDTGDLAPMMTEINRHLSLDAHAGRFMTLFYGVLDGTKRDLRWVSAGHAPALIYDPGSDAFVELPGRDIPLGIDGSWAYHQEVHKGWKKGQVMAVGTDGIWEMRNEDGDMFGMETLHRIIRENAKATAADICTAVSDELNTHRGTREAEDDVTLVVIKFLE